MDLLARILQKSKVPGTHAKVCFISSIVLREHCSILVSNKIGIPNQTKLVEQLLRAKYVTLSGMTSPTHTQLAEHGGKNSAKIEQHTQPTQNTNIGSPHPG